MTSFFNRLLALLIFLLPSSVFLVACPVTSHVHAEGRSSTAEFRCHSNFGFAHSIEFSIEQLAEEGGSPLSVCTSAARVNLLSSGFTHRISSEAEHLK